MNEPYQNDVDIRPWSEGDLPLLQRLMGDPVMTAFLGGPETPEKIRERHQRYCQIIPTGTGQMFAIVVGVDKVSAGSIGYWEKDWRGQRVWETGWSVLPEFQGQGIATRATITVLDWARRAGRHRFIHALPDISNGASNAVCGKAGFSLRGEADFEYPPGNVIRCNDWFVDLFADDTEFEG